MVVPFQKGNLCIECNEFKQKVFVILSYSFKLSFFFLQTMTRIVVIWLEMIYL
jgi:hypothetical protein